MNIKTYIRYLIVIACFFMVISCNNDQLGVNKYFYVDHGKTINIKDSIEDIPLDLYFSSGFFEIIDSFLVIYESAPMDERSIHLVNKNNFNYIASTGIIGKGPGELRRGGSFFIDKERGVLWVNDFGKYKILQFPIDSILANKDFIPSISLDMNKEIFLDRGEFISDGILLGTAVIPIDASTAEQRVAKFSLYSQEIERYGFEQDNIRKQDSYSQFSLSMSNKKYIRTFSRKNLMLIFNIEGDLVCRVSGSKEKKSDDSFRYFHRVCTYKKYIIASYYGCKPYREKDNHLIPSSPSILLVFDFKGNHVETIDTGHGIQNIIADESNDRLIVFFSDKEPALGYVNLDKILP